MTKNEAIDILKELPDRIIGVIMPSDKFYDYKEAIDLAIKALKERPQGEWIDYNNTFYKCPDCGYLLEKCCPQCQNMVILPTGGIKTKESEYLALKAENRRLTGELEQVYERLNDLTEKIKKIAEKHNIKATNVENLQENDIK